VAPGVVVSLRGAEGDLGIGVRQAAIDRVTLRDGSEIRIGFGEGQADELFAFLQALSLDRVKRPVRGWVVRGSRRGGVLICDPAPLPRHRCAPRRPRNRTPPRKAETGADPGALFLSGRIAGRAAIKPHAARRGAAHRKPASDISGVRSRPPSYRLGWRNERATGCACCSTRRSIFCRRRRC